MITLVVGGVRSGKSVVAEQLAAAGTAPVTYVATGSARDDGMRARIDVHRARRPATWSTVEEPRAVAKVLREVTGTVLLDGLGPWLANDLDADVEELVQSLAGRRDDTIIVTDEVGLAVHPVTELGRRFTDRLGEVNQRVSARADRCVLVVAGRAVELPNGDPVAAADLPVASGHGLAGALGFLLSMGRAVVPGPRALDWFPVAGAAIGLVLGGLWWLVAQAGAPLLAATLVVAADIALTGALHLDGLVDSADGLLAPVAREQRLRAMADPRAGAFGVVAVVAVLLLRTAALASFSTAHPLLLAAIWTVSRGSMAVAARTLRYARERGTASAFLGGTPWMPAVTTIVIAGALAVLDGGPAVVGVVVAGAAAASVHVLARNRIGGFTGDTLGGAGVVGETIGLVAAALLR